ncbi:hypothetical protein PVAP13_2NG595320 [Panicum virgatum]|uniref:Uncharacterized protein n=1 Tax=Panicum virgatum TaxID=38727 RepID=A0A8T0VZ62_PANVG|nr:hypothetical protein PVAP13_2NG595320 [Panicum virgatum]
MESTALIAPLPLLTSRSRSKPLSPASIRARRPASIPFYGSGRVVLFSRRGREYAGVGSLVSAAPEVTSATVDFKEANAVVWTTAEARASDNWQKQCGEKLAKHLGTCGFESRLQE